MKFNVYIYKEVYLLCKSFCFTGIAEMFNLKDISKLEQLLKVRFDQLKFGTLVKFMKDNGMNASLERLTVIFGGIYVNITNYFAITRY